MATFQEIASALEKRVNGFKKFKIGKTGQTVKERFEQEHSKTYSFYESLGTSSIAKTIDGCEQYLIDYFKKLPNNDNQQGAAGAMTEDSKLYSVYVVWN